MGTGTNYFPSEVFRPVPEADELGGDGLPVRTWEVHSQQQAVLLTKTRFQVLPAGRRWGKSEVAVMWIIRKAQEATLNGVSGVIWIVYPTYAIARIAWRKFRKLAPSGWVTQYLGTDMHPEAIRIGNVVVEFKSGASPGTLVGEGLLAVWIDECGEIKERVWAESLRPTLIDYAAPALLTGTPKGHNWFWRMFVQGQDPSNPDTVSYSEKAGHGLSSYGNPFISRSELDSMAREMSTRLFEQEIMAGFLSDEGAVLKLERIRTKGLRYSTQPTVALGIDLARRMDWTVIVGMDRDFGVTHFERFNNIDWPLQKKRIEATWLALNKPALVIDATGVGDPMVQELQYSGVYVAEAFLFNAISKRQLVESLAMACDAAVLTLPDEPTLLNEMEAFEMTALPSGSVRYAAPEGEHDDCVMALGLALRGASRWGDLGITIGRIQ